MSEQQDEGQVWDAPNQQVVRADQSAPWDEGEGGEQEEGPGVGPLEEWTKAQLLEEAQRLGLSPANAAMTKDELREALEAHLEEHPF